MTDVRDTDITTPEAETFESDQVQDSQPTGDEGVVDQEAHEEDGEPVVPNGRITLAELNEKSQAIGQALYAQQAEAPTDGFTEAGQAGQSGQAGSADDDVVDAEIVDEDENK